LLFDDALRASGQTALADDLARKFCDIASRSQMPQSFDAVSGRGLRESGSAWTASAFLVLAHTLNR
jgi:hypothetical protein